MSNENYCQITPQTTWQNTTMGGTIYTPGNAQNFETGDWRSKKPKYLKEKCKQCLLCVPTCPDNAIPVNSEGKREDFNFSACKGCLVCKNACPFKAIAEEGEDE